MINENIIQIENDGHFRLTVELSHNGEGLVVRQGTSWLFITDEAVDDLADAADKLLNKPQLGKMYRGGQS